MTRTHKILAAVVAAGIAVGGFYYVALKPKRDEIAKLDSDIAAQETALEQARQQLTTYEQARAEYKANYAMLARLGKAVPADDDVRSLLVQLASTADRTGVDFQTVEVGAGEGVAAAPEVTTDPAAAGASELAAAPGTVEVAGGALRAMPFSFTFNGHFFELSTFLSRVEKFVTLSNDRMDAKGRLLRLESIQLLPAPSGYPLMRAQVGAASYLVPPLEGVTEVDQSSAQQASAGSTTPSDGGAPPTTTTATATGATP